ncbi:MAG: hypothetical protein AB7I19_02345 [Planctomycetota bacterium]
MRRPFLILPVVVIAVAVVGLLWSNVSDTEAPPDTTAEADTRDSQDRQANYDSRSSDDVERAEVDRLALELGIPELAEDDDENGAALALKGRVIDRLGAPLAGATVRVRARRNVRAFFEGNNGGPQLDGEVDWQRLFRQRNLGKETTSDREGVYRLEGRTFARGASLEIQVTHPNFAPSITNADWAPQDGELSLPDVVLGTGSTIAGIVVGPTGVPVAEAEVRLEFQGGGFGPGGPGQGGPGGRGGRGGFGGRGNDNGGIAALLTAVVTDPSGRFRFEHVPAGNLTLTATAKRHLDARSEAITSADDAILEVGELKLGPGSELTGVVTDEAGQPVADARVSVRGSNAAREETNDAQGNPGRGGDRGRGGPGGFFRGAAEARTDRNGRYVLDRVPAGPLLVSVRHDQYVDAEFDPLDSRIQTSLDFRLLKRPAVVGTVIDAATGEPIANFGIRWRRDNAAGLQGRLAGMADRFTNGAFAGADQNPEIAEVRQQANLALQEFERARQEADQRRRTLLGGSGQIPGNTPKPTQHAEGKFRLEDIEPGSFLLDVDAPGYVKVAAGPFVAGTDQAPAAIVIPLERGQQPRGRVVAADTGAPIPNARIILRTPRPASQANDPFAAVFGMQRGGRGGNGGPGRGGRGGPPWMGGEAIAQARSGSDGRFEFPALRAGRYGLDIRVEGFPDFSSEEFDLLPNSGEHVLRVTPGARLFGVVRGLEAGTRATLELTHSELPLRRTARVDPNTNEYSATGLAAGGWIVQIVGQGQRGSFRQRLGALLGSTNQEQPDVIVQAGQELRHDIDAASAVPGVVTGTILRNGEPGAGLEVRLIVLNDQTPAVTEAEAALTRFSRMAGGRMLRGAVDATSGTFRIDSVSSGRYRAEVWEEARRGGRSNAPRVRNDQPLYSTEIEVRRGQTEQVHANLRTGSLRLALRRSDQGEIGRVTVQLVRRADASDPDPATWKALASLRQLTARGGDAELGNLPSDVYRYSVEVAGCQPLRGEIALGMGAAEIEGLLELAPANSATPNQGR